eukprot:CAMPEP_0115147192 /NCGR_PEP_ID=MMETSP0227-20121206/63156_1 /TAXON_ID=89957 /ORGANISM="Polarella glacialis, Strain CCMP 1383" /LENGTH=73 /DNA_ID=CAMNT_0002557037 /DNA_START=66 /DNA_END=283 /DNA_ORIENTATION=-
MSTVEISLSSVQPASHASSSQAPLQTSSQIQLVRNSLCAGTAAAIATGLFNPLDTLRVRWQLAPVLAAQATVT